MNETLKLRGLGGLRLVPVRADLLADAVAILARRAISQPDALQVATCKDVRAAALVSGDERLVQAGVDEGVVALNPRVDGRQLEAL